MTNVGRELAAVLKRMQVSAQGPAVKAAATAAGRGGETLTKMTLQLSSHAAGDPTPSAPGSPPSKVSGTLARSVHRTPTAVVGAGIAVTEYGPTVIYGIVQEFGMTISVRNARVLYNRDTQQAFGQQVTLPARPFMRPSAVKLAESGKLAELAGKAFQTVLLA